MGSIRIVMTLCALGVASISAAQQRPDTFGTTATSYAYVGAAQFRGDSQTVPYTLVYRLGITSGNFVAQPQLPSGALLTEIQWDICDSDGGASPLFFVGLLDRTGSEAGISLASGPISPGCNSVVQDLSSNNLIVRNTQNHLDLALSAAEPVELVGALVGYKLQVSPAPAAASFNDVPTSDFGFQYIEALVAAGITGGCGGGNYCPNDAVTRRQMAIFISKALGLQWP